MAGKQYLKETMMNPDKKHSWKVNKMEVFWGEIAPFEHVVQIYENENVFLDTLAGFAGDGLTTGDTVMIIATEEHTKALNQRLLQDKIDIQPYINASKYITRDAEECLSEFLVNNFR